MGTRSWWCQPRKAWKTDLFLGGKGRQGTSPVVRIILQGERREQNEGKDKGNKSF